MDVASRRLALSCKLLPWDSAFSLRMQEQALIEDRLLVRRTVTVVEDITSPIPMSK
jgi:hypothetical protein